MRIQLSKFTNIVVAAVMIVLGSVLLVNTSSQAQSDESDVATANTLRVAPLRTDVTADPGESKTVSITVTNPTVQTVRVSPIQNDFVAEGEDGTPALILEEDQFAPKHSLKRMLQPLQSVDIPAGESRVVDVVISVPADAEAGGYFGAIRFAPTDPDTGGQVNMSASVASLILLRVNGDAPEKLTLTDFDVQQAGVAKTFFTNADSMSVMTRFFNEGGVQLSPIGKISITKGNTLVHEIDFNNKEQRDMVLPDSARRWSMPITAVDGFGKYTVTGTFTYGLTNQTIEITKSFWMVPMSMIIAAGVALVIIVAVVVGLIIRSRNRSRSMSFGSRR